MSQSERFDASYKLETPMKCPYCNVGRECRAHLKLRTPGAAASILNSWRVVMGDSPLNGDVLITSERGRHLLSIVPYPHRLSVSQYTVAFQIAKKWAETNKVNIWLTSDGVVTKVQRD
jgi:hypothetical protein